MSFDVAQTFYLDPSVVQNAAECSITKIDLFFRAKPKVTGNKSGIQEPGVEVFLAPTLFGIPLVDEIGVIRPTEPAEHGARFNPRVEVARVEYGEIQVSDDASAPTSFRFANPVNLKTGYEYAIVVKYDGNEDYILWYSREGDPLLGTNKPSPGPSGQFIGKYFTYISPVATDHNPANAALGYTNTSIAALTADNPALIGTDTNKPAAITTADQEYVLGNWRPSNDKDLKFRVYAARYAHNGVPVCANNTITDDPSIDLFGPDEFVLVSNNLLQIVCPAYPLEYILYDSANSNQFNVRFGDYVYQETVYYPGGKATPLTIGVESGNVMITCNSGYTLANGKTFTWSDHYGESGDSEEYIVVTSLNHFGANIHAVNVRKVIEVDSNTTIVVDEPLTFTNTAAYFFKSPVGRLYSKSRAYELGLTEDIMILNDSNANASVRFVNNTILTISIANGGTSYSNSDYLTITGYENVSGEVEGGYPAIANIVTNSSGGITAVYLSNVGCGFIDANDLVFSISNSSNQPSTGANAEFEVTIGATLKTEFSGGQTFFSNCTVINLEATEIKPEITVNNPSGTAFTIKHKTKYHMQRSSNTSTGYAYFVDDTPHEMTVKIFKTHQFPSDNTPVLPSRSNEYVIRYANGASQNTSALGIRFSRASQYIFEMSSNNDFTSVFIEPAIINAHYGRYNVNNDYTNEHTNYGNAYAKHVTKKVNFADNRKAEDLLVYLTAWKPENCDIQVYARIHNSEDYEAFDDKDWTRLELKDGIGVHSSSANPADFIELTYGFQSSPNNTILDGTVTTELDNTAIIGSGTTFNTDLAANDIVRIYSRLFEENHMVAVVNSVTNATHLTLKTPIANNGLVGPGFKIAKIDYKHQGFNNILNDNVVRYYSTSMVEYDTYDTFQIKIVLLSNTYHVVPKVDDVRAVGVTA